MIEFSIPNISCGHCAAAVTRTAKAVDSGAEVTVDVPARRVAIRSDQPGDTFAKALGEAGYAPDAATAS